MHDIQHVAAIDIDAELDRLAGRYRKAGGAGVRLLNRFGGRAEAMVAQLPAPVRDGLYEATERALAVAVRVSQSSRRAVPDQAPWVNTAVTAAMGAAGGFGGLPAALVELPLTTTMLLRAIQGAAAREGFDPAAPGVMFDSVRVLAASGPLASDDGADLGFFSVRLTLTGSTVQALISGVAPRLAAAMGQKLAAQSVPVLGALAGGGANYMYTRYYQEVARVHFGLRNLAVNADVPHEQLVQSLSDRMQRDIK